MNKILPAWLRQNIDKRVVMISGVSITAALMFWGCITVIKKLRKKKVLELLDEQAKTKNLNVGAKKVLTEKIEMLSSEELKTLTETLEQNKEVNLEVEIDKIILANLQKEGKAK